ncbi:MAG: nitroreductase family deazaflavin-dependent oxidoreductase [Streptosporangiales bacterium]|nr:nitroreductase family deazaflavin-dependent oxidoreductase [Streptosporangiales bacterium]MBO0891170.1 nitroreductase family deazaflavin-dependent oxidoreductase [Acidothermales bacterium]
MLYGKEHVDRYLATDGAEGHDWQGGTSTLILTTTGRRTGEPRDNALIYGRDGDAYVVVASKGGADEHPLWYLNLVADPTVQVQVRGDRFTARARTATAGEKARLWPAMAKEWPAYDDYQRKTDRDIPVVILERV